VKPGTATCKVSLMHDGIAGAVIQHTAATTVTDANEASP
jgi:hypothetical protein